MRWFRHLTGTLPGRLLGEVFRRVGVGDVTAPHRHLLLQMAVRTKNYGYVSLSCTSRFLAHLANKIETLMLWRGTRLSVRSQESLLLLRFESSLHRVVT